MKRVQRKRTKGWRMPPRTRYVGRGTKWGNPHKVTHLHKRFYVSDGWRYDFMTKQKAAKFSCELFRVYALKELIIDPHWLDELREFDALACWCALEDPCHVDVIIELMEEREL